MKQYFILFLLLIVTYLSADELLIEDIEFIGNNRFSSSELHRHILSKIGDMLNNEQLNEDRLRLLNFYQLSNMAITSISYPEKIPTKDNKVKIVFHIREKENPQINDIRFTGNNYLSEQKIKQHIYFKANQYKIQDIETIQQKILDIYLERSFLFCQVSYQGMTVENDTLIANFKIDEHKQVIFKNAMIKGNKVSKDTSIIRISKLKKDMLINYDLLKNAENKLNSKDYIKQAYILPINEETILFDISESKMTHIEGLFSFNQSEKNSAIGFLKFDFLNLFGTDRTLNFHWQSSQNQQKSLKMKYSDPGPIQIPVGYNLSFQREEADSSYIKVLSEAEIYTYFDKHQTGIIISLNDINPGTRIFNNYDKNTQNNIGFFWNYNSFDYPRNPTSGMHFYYKHILNKSKKQKQVINRQADEFIASLTNSITNKIIIYNSINAKYIQNKSLEVYDLYTAGGTFSIRGFPENFFYGNKVFWINNELRLLTNRDSRFFVFIDYGHIKDERVQIVKSYKNIIGYGAGLRLLTRAGILRMDYGLHYYDNIWTSPMEGFVHLGIETSF
ncbi:MAG: POTRA domain-containing protein [Candidatus Cloacimonadales bacterium]|jgi:outer membrane protein assembly factor BamA|nr:POTRA domain-containing protein [Candidatus Cloacimonadota bacterium]MDD3501029.1 POTRA domain-containing protein [Candidatus Cloacimonadota bacterium]MDX9977211.1 POTRA domain-containing protein [Candidatus Cloacimonadales bacterium]